MSASFGGAQGDESIGGLEAIRNAYGEEEARAHETTLKALRAFIRTAERYYLAEPGSDKETVALGFLKAMMRALADKPEKTMTILEGLLAYTVHIEHGGTREEWFRGVEE
jgi:hypothetical protein